MIRLVVTYFCKENERDNFLQALKEAKIGELSRSDEGNIQYDYFTSIDSDNVVLLEKWENEEALKAHAQKDHLKKAQEIGLKYCKDVKLEKYDL